MNTKLKFLLVDDYSNIRSLVQKQLKEIGFEGSITEATNGKEAVDLLTKHNLANSNPFDFIISDWNMPEMTGIELLKWTRKQEKLQNTPFIILTTVNEKDKIFDAVKNGVSNFLIKPWEQEELEDKVQQCLDKHGM